MCRRWACKVRYEAPLGRNEEPEHPGNGPGGRESPETPPVTTRKTQPILIQSIPREIRLGFADGTSTSAVVANADPERDIAVLTPAVQPGLVLPATIGNSSAIRVGDEVYAVGNPLGLVGSLSAGVVSGLDRHFAPSEREEPLRELIQFDAAVNPGNSGGPLLDRRGRVVGIVIGLINPTEQDVFIGAGFAVPIRVAVGAAGGPAQ